MKTEKTTPPLSAASEPTFADVACVVAGPDTPAWLVAHFQQWAPSLMVDRIVEGKQPTRVAMKNWLTEVKDAALLLRDAMSDSAIREFLEIVPQYRIEYGGAIDQCSRILPHAQSAPWRRRYS